jgi:hypothetical protein
MSTSTILDQLAPAIRGATFVGVVTGVERGFRWFEKALNSEAKERLTRWLKNVPGHDQINSWASIFPHLIDRVFGERVLSWRFSLRSALASLLAITTVGILAATLRAMKRLPNLFKIRATRLWIVLLVALAGNCIPDYFSLIISRSIVRGMARRPQPFSVALLLFLNLGLVAVVGTIFIRVAVDLTEYVFNPFNEPFHMLYWGLKSGNLLSVLISSFTRSNLLHVWRKPLALFVAATFFTSIWVWLYVLALVAIRLLSSVMVIWVKVVPFLDLEKSPMVATGRVAGLIAGVGYLVVWAALSLLHVS